MLAFKGDYSENNVMSTVFENQPIIEGFGQAFKQEVSDGYSQALRAVSANAAKKGYMYLVEPLDRLAAGTEYEYLPEDITRTACLQRLEIVGQFAENPDFGRCKLFSDSYTPGSEDEADILSEIETFVDVLSDSPQALPFQEHSHLAGFGEVYPTVIPDIYLYVSHFSGEGKPEGDAADENGEDSATAKVSIFRAKNIKGKLVKTGRLEAKII